MWKVAYDARDAYAEPVRGWGRYARHLLEHLPATVHPYLGPGRGPEVLWEQIRFPQLAARDGASLIHSPNCFLPLVRPCPGVVTVHDLAFESFPEDFTPRTRTKYRRLTPLAARSAERVICVSEFTADDLVARYGVSRGKLRVIPNAPGLPVGGAPVPQREPYLLAVGDLRGKKNLERLIAAHARLGTGHRLVLAGLGEPPGTLPEGVEAPGFLDDAALDALLRGASALVHPSLYEGFGLVVAEAMARGVPVACSGTSALPETAGGAAVLFDPYDVAAITAGVASALERSEELRAAGLERARAWSWERSAAATVAVYEELL
ncbi:MAG: glycosyltransferase family 4 protein [Solirubrobacterales bacterium]|nr:glycosyltransferase family 4 protein [Solirubrobacterales bacterium]